MKTPTLLSMAASELGRKGGQAKSQRKTKACRLNASLPRKRHKLRQVPMNKL